MSWPANVAFEDDAEEAYCRRVAKTFSSREQFEKEKSNLISCEGKKGKEAIIQFKGCAATHFATAVAACATDAQDWPNVETKGRKLPERAAKELG